MLRVLLVRCIFFFFKQKTAYEMRISDWSSDVCSSDLAADQRQQVAGQIVTGLGEQAGHLAVGQCGLADLAERGGAAHGGNLHQLLHLGVLERRRPPRQRYILAKLGKAELAEEDAQIGRASCRETESKHE